jgi:gliding motility-associated-like protein
MVGDHTPNDSEGNYMLVNASNTPGTIYTDTAHGLCPNTVYVFGMWATPVMTSFACDGSPVLPNIHYQLLTLNGTVLAEDSTGFLPIVNERDWKYYGLSITTPASISDVIVKLSIYPPHGCGAAFAVDDITLQPCSPSTISASINGAPGPVDVCADYTDNWVLQANYTPGFSNPVFQWQASLDSGRTWVDIPGATSLSYNVPHRTGGTVLYRICIAENGNINSLTCRITSNVIHTGVHPVPPPDPPQTVFGCLGKDYHFPTADPAALQVLWSGPNGFSTTSYDAVIPNVQYTDSGLYQLKKTFYFGCVLLDTFHLQVFPGTTISVTPVNPICEGTSERFLASATDSVGYLWTPPTGLSDPTIPNPVASPVDSTQYTVVATNRYGCKDSATLVLGVYKKPVADAGPELGINAGDSIMINGSVSGSLVNYSWSPNNYINDVNLEKPTVYPPQDFTYTLTVSSTVGCGTSTSTVLVKVFRDIFIPTAFTPNNDGKNDRFRVYAAANYKKFSLSVYNRWGQAVFRTTDISKEWDGRVNDLPQAAGVYVYYVEIVTANNKKISRKGVLTLVR